MDKLANLFYPISNSSARRTTPASPITPCGCPQDTTRLSTGKFLFALVPHAFPMPYVPPNYNLSFGRNQPFVV